MKWVRKKYTEGSSEGDVVESFHDKADFVSVKFEIVFGLSWMIIFD